jgi:Tfp pilus assembly protein PilF
LPVHRADGAAERDRLLREAEAADYYAMGRQLEIQGRLDEAEASYRKALALAPAHARAHNNLGCILHLRGELDAALACYRRALDLEPGLPEASQNYASIAGDSTALAQAIEGYERQVRDNPGDAMALSHLGSSYAEVGRHAEALAALDKALAADPELARAHFTRALVLLRCGEYAEGWKEYEWRWRIEAFSGPARRFSQPMWDGRELAAGTLLLHAEQGMGDTLQFVRYASLAARRCAAVVLECQPPLKSLLSCVDGVRQVIAQGEPLPPFDAHLPLMSSPAVFGTTLATIPWDGPYIRPPANAIAEWRSRLARDRGPLKVGLAWAGSSGYSQDRLRSLPLDRLAPLARAPETLFYSLQRGDAATQALAPPDGMRLLDPAAQSRNFSDAALIANLDLVVSVDTSVAHLAGAMGVATWVLLPFDSEWRYHLGRHDNPWYPSMRLYRQDESRSWTEPIARLAQDLIAFPREAG